MNEQRLDKFRRAAMDDSEMLDYLKEQIGETTGEKVTVLYASDTGTTSDLARSVQYEMKRRGVAVKCMPYNDFDVSDLAGEKTILNLVATCGQGEFPDNSKAFHKDIMDENLPADYLDGVRFATFGMGDSAYVYYNECATIFDDRFVALGATSMLPIGMGDDQDEDKWETAWEEWNPELWNELGTEAPPQEMLPPSYQAVVESAESAAANGLEQETRFIMPGDSVMLPLTKSELLTPGGRDLRHLEWGTKEAGVSYQVGDALGIHSANPEDRVNEFLDWYGNNPTDVVSFDDSVMERDPEMPTVTTMGQLCTQVLDLFSRPKRQFYDNLACFATDDGERDQLNHLISKEGKADFREMVNETKTYADLMRMFPSAKVPPEYLLDCIPPIKPRLYSISSAPEMHPDHIHLCVVEEDWETPSGVQRRGQSTWFVRNQFEGREWGNPGHGPASGTVESGNVQEPYGELSYERAPLVPCRVNPAVVHMPDPSDWTMMVGLGTGLAPFRSFIQQRVVQKQKGTDVAPMALYFGARFEATEYLYGDEIDAYHEDGIVTELKKVRLHYSLVLSLSLSLFGSSLQSIFFPFHFLTPFPCPSPPPQAFSRDQEEKIYAQHRIAEDPGLVCKYLLEKEGKFYLCGPAGNMPAQVRACGWGGGTYLRAALLAHGLFLAFSLLLFCSFFFFFFFFLQMREAVLDAFVSAGGLTPEQADAKITAMQISGHYNVEVW